MKVSWLFDKYCKILFYLLIFFKRQIIYSFLINTNYVHNIFCQCKFNFSVGTYTILQPIEILFYNAYCTKSRKIKIKLIQNCILIN